MKTALLTFGSIVLVAIIIPFLFYISLTLWGDWHDEWSGYNASTYLGDGYCNIAVLPILGEVHSYGTLYDESGNALVSTNMNDALSFLNQAETEPGILGVLALIDSPGGSAAAAKLIADELQNSAMPNAAYIVNTGTSAAYLVATGADTIIASPFSDVGSIGITMSHLNYAKQNEEEGIEYISLSSGKFKDYGDPDKVMTEEERTLLKRDLAVWHDEFVKEVAINRDLPVEDIAKLADGSSVPASLAQEAKLVDAVGDKDVARNWFANKLNLAPEDIVFCN